MSIPQQIMAHFSKEVPPLLWHYTNPQALRSIVATRALWMTDTRFQADKAEFIHAREFIERTWESAKNKATTATARKAIEDLGAGEQRTFYDLEAMQVFILSFTERKDDLAQWRQFASQCTGAALGFDLRNLRLELPQDRFSCFAPCIYREREKLELITLAVQMFVDSLIDLDKEVESEHHAAALIAKEQQICRIHGIPFTRARLDEATHIYVRSRLQAIKISWVRCVYNLAAYCKQSAYEMEQEWRYTFAADPKSAEFKTFLHHYDRNGLSVPYLPDAFLVGPSLQEVHLASLFTEEHELSHALQEQGLSAKLSRTTIRGC